MVEAVILLEDGLERSKFNYLFKILLIRLYFELGVCHRALDISHSLDVKQILHDTLGYLYTTELEKFAINSHIKRQFSMLLSIYTRNEIEVLIFLI